MALPSQIGQGGPGSRVSTSSRRDRTGRTPKVAAGALLLIAAAALTWIMLRGKTSPPPTAAQPVAEPVKLAASDPAPAAPAPAPNPAPAKAESEQPISLLSQATRPTPPANNPAPVRPPASGPTPAGAPAGSQAAGITDATKPSPADLTSPGSTLTPREAPASGTAAPPSSPLPATSSSAGVRAMIEEGDRKAESDPVGARERYSRALADSRTTPADSASLRDKLARINDDLIFSTKYTKGEPFTEEYTVQAGDNPTKIFRKRDLSTEPRLIEKINKTDATRLRVGQKLKLVRGPFHAVVHKADFRLDLYAGSPDDQASWVFIKSFKVGLGESNSTPVGTFTVKSSSKLINPPWTNPKTGEKFGADDPKNPIGERWIGIEGVGDARQYTGFGIHGTIDPDSIGKMKSMGCIRMNSADVETVYDLLAEKISVVRIEP